MKPFQQLLLISNMIQADLRNNMNLEPDQCIYCKKHIPIVDDTFEDVIFGLTGMCEECFDTQKINRNETEENKNNEN